MLLVLTLAGGCGWTTIRVYEPQSGEGVFSREPENWCRDTHASMRFILGPGATLGASAARDGAGLVAQVAVRVIKGHRVQFDPPEVILASAEFSQPLILRLSMFSVQTFGTPGVAPARLDHYPANGELIGQDRNALQPVTAPPYARAPDTFLGRVRTLGVQPTQFTLRFTGLYVDGVRMPDLVVPFMSYEETHLNCPMR
jgi:hypothetical protein